MSNVAALFPPFNWVVIAGPGFALSDEPNSFLCDDNALLVAEVKGRECQKFTGRVGRIECCGNCEEVIQQCLASGPIIWGGDEPSTTFEPDLARRIIDACLGDDDDDDDDENKPDGPPPPDGEKVAA
jgi:hypothetical protein